MQHSLDHTHYLGGNLQIGVVVPGGPTKDPWHPYAR